MVYEFLDIDGVVIGCGTEAELAEYLANGWVAAGTVLGGRL